MHNYKNFWLPVGAITLVFATSTAFAQPADNAQSGAQAPETRQRVLEEVLVTARRREETLQETPVAVSAFSSADLQAAGVHKTTDLEHSVPGLSFGSRSSKSKTITIRGVGQREATPVLDPGVSVYLNSIYIPRQDAQLLDTVDTQNIQVLRGPQGTLFGKNTTGGAILVDTKQPDFDEWDGALNLRLGNYGRRDARLSGNIPLIPATMGMRIAVNSTRYDGFIKNDVDNKAFGDEDRLSATARLLWQVNDRFSADVFAYVSRLKERSAPLTCVFQNPEASVPQLLFPARPDFEPSCLESERAFNERDRVTVNTDESVFEIDSQILALTLTWEWDNADLKSITGWSYQDGITDNSDQDATPVEILSNGSLAMNRTLRADGKRVEDEERQQISQEFQFNSSAFNDRLQYTLGAFGSLERVRNTPSTTLVGPKGLAGIRPSLITNALLPVPFQGLDDGFVFPLATFMGLRSDLDNDTWAVFAQGTYDITEWLQFTLGGRYTVERRERDITVFDIDTDEYGQRIGATFIDDAGFYSPITVAQFNQLGENLPDLPLIERRSADVQSRSFRQFTPSATLSLLAPDNLLLDTPIDNLMMYLTYSEGFKAGGFEPRGIELVGFDPEEVINTEIGVKLDAFDSRLRLNAAAYNMSYENIQVRVAEQGERISDILFFLDNAAKATVRGAELEATLVLGNWLLQGNYSYTDASYDDFMSQVVTPGAGASIVDRSDEPFQLVPETTYALTAQYQWLSPVGMITPRLTYIYRDELFTGIDFKAIEFDNSTIDELKLWNARLSWLPSENLLVAAYVNNLTDEKYFAAGFAVSDTLGSAPMSPGEPRTYGLEFEYRF